jgi:two-component system, OmpR family, sensor kinase
MTIRLPLAVKIPLVVTVFMAAVAIFVSERVLTRLEDAQTRHLNDLATVYLDGLASALADPVVREDVWETFDILDRARQTHAGMKPTETVVANSDGRVLASSSPRAVPPRSHLPAKFVDQQATRPAVLIRDGDEAVARRDLSTGGRVVGSVHAAFDIAPLVAERRSVLFALIATNAILTGMFAAAAWLTVTRMLRPVRVLTAHLQGAAEHRGELIPARVVAQAPGEFRPLFQSFNDMADALREREALAKQLADEERLASLGRLASGMAHEINNPLGGLFNAIDTLKEHGGRPEVRRRTIDLIERGLRGIRDVVRTTLVTYRTDRDASVLKATEIDDLKLLVEPEVRRKELRLRWTNAGYDDVAISPSIVRQIILNLLLNACQAAPVGGKVSLHAGIQGALFVVSVADSGPGLPDAGRQMLLGLSDRLPMGSGGLGLWMVRRLLKEVGGIATVEEGKPSGTAIRINIPVRQEALADVA